MNRRIPNRIKDPVRHYRLRLTEILPSPSGVPHLFLAPFYIVFFSFLGFPVFYTFYLSFFEFQGVSHEPLLGLDFGIMTIEIPSIANLEFVGLDNYQQLLTDGIFHQSLINTAVIFVIQVPIMVGLAMALALALNAAFVRLKGLFRSIIILPVTANLVAYSVVFIIIVAEGGLLDMIFQAVGIDPIAWLSNGYWSRNLIALMSVWRWTGYNMIILLAGLQTVSQSLYEAAEIDGANKLQKFWYITIPQMKPVLLFVFVTSTIGVFNKFAEPMLLIEAGAPLRETRTVVVYIYQIAFQNLQLGYAAALTYALISIVTILSILQMRWED